MVKSSSRKIRILVLALLCCIDVAAQRQLTVLSSETYMPLKDVTVRVDSLIMKTDYLGRVPVPEYFDSIQFSHVEYSPEKLSFREVGDTMYLFPSRYVLKEVVVLGISPDMRKSMDKARERRLKEPTSFNPLSFDLGRLLDRRGRRDRKQMQRLQDAFRKFDMK
ncbi:MAG: hypothetical protein J5610_04870 [Prevotella sp.]|nr:hypothetical protein [Prevotella sp.]